VVCLNESWTMQTPGGGSLEVASELQYLDTENLLTGNPRKPADAPAPPSRVNHGSGGFLIPALKGL